MILAPNLKALPLAVDRVKKEAKERAAENLRAAHKNAVLRLYEALEPAAAANAEVARIFQLAKNQFPYLPQRGDLQPIAMNAGIGETSAVWPELGESNLARRKNRAMQCLAEAEEGS